MRNFRLNISSNQVYMRKSLVLTLCLYLVAAPICRAESVGTDYLMEVTAIPKKHAKRLAVAGPPSVAAPGASPGKGTPPDPGALKTAMGDGKQESGANQIETPPPILRTGSDVKSDVLSPNAIQLAKDLNLYTQLKSVSDAGDFPSGTLEQRVSRLETRERVSELLRKFELEVAFVLSEIYDEQSLYNEQLVTIGGERDKLIAITNAASFGTNGILWAICESLAIPTNTHPNYTVSSGIIGILAGIVPSIASALTLKEVNGSKHSAPADANMLAKIFDRPVRPHNDYPDAVWTFLDTAPADGDTTKRRREQIIDRWVADNNIPAFTDRKSAAQIDIVTASTPLRKQLTMSVLSTRLNMLQQLASEIFKMNRLLLELEMVLTGHKHVP